MATAFETLEDNPVFLADCCAGVSKPLINTLEERLPQTPGLTLSVGSGSGVLEAMVLQAAEAGGRPVDLFGVEVSSSTNVHLPAELVLTVATTSSVHDYAMLATALMFVYPRTANIIAKYLCTCLPAARLEKVIWLGHRNDWPEVEKVLSAAFVELERIDGPGICDSELLVIASMPRRVGGIT